MKSWILMLAASLLFTACEKENEKQAADTICLDGTIEWGGDPAVDGSGWTFVPTETNQHYFLANLPEEYKQDDLQVAVCLQQTDYKANCFCAEQPYVFAITSINRK